MTAKIIQFTPRQDLSAAENLAEFVRLSREDLTLFSGSEFDWNNNYWPSAGVSFGNLDQKSRVLDPKNTMQKPFLEFAKAYLRYQQSHNPTKNFQEMSALKCIERALIRIHGCADILKLDSLALDISAKLADAAYSAGIAYHTGRQIERLASFVTKKRLIPGVLDWQNPFERPTDTIRTGEKARKNREKKLPSQEALDALADIFANNPTASRDIFTSSTCLIMLSVPDRVSEVLSLPVDCEVWQTKKDGSKAYGWRFQPGKGGKPSIKWVPDVMVSVAQEAISRLRKLTDEARKIALWHEENSGKFYRHKDCPNVPENQPLTIVETCLALGIPTEDMKYCRSQLRRLGFSDKDHVNTLSMLATWATNRLPKDFPWFDKERGIKYSNALFCLQAKQLREDWTSSPIFPWRPDQNTLNNDLGRNETSPGYTPPSIFDRHGFNLNRETPLDMTSHQFRHLLNTMAQRGGLSQEEIARWSGRADMKQNRAYDHMTEFELVAMIRSNDSSLSLDRPLQEIAEQLSAKIPMTRQEFNTLTMPTAHITEYGFCVHDFTMSPCQRFRDCLNCTEQVCIKGDRRLARIKERYIEVKRLKDQAEREISEGTAGADRWFEIHDFTEKRLAELIGILEDPAIQDGAIVKLRNEFEFSPIRRAVEAKLSNKKNIPSQDRPFLEDMRAMLGGGLG